MFGCVTLFGHCDVQQKLGRAHIHVKERLITGNGNDEITGGRPDSFCGLRGVSFAVSSRLVIIDFHVPSRFSTNLTNTCVHAVVGVTTAMTKKSE